jgi:hypothetical protein
MALMTRRIVLLVSAWAVFLAVYATLSLTHAHDRQMLSTFGNLVQCLVPLLANAGLLLNAGTPHWRRNVFWMLLAMSCTLWMIGQFEWTYYEVYLHKSLPDPYPGDILFFLRGIPVMAALALRPHLKRGELRMRFGYLDFAVLLTWWTYLIRFYGYAVDLRLTFRSAIQLRFQCGHQRSEHGDRGQSGRALAALQRRLAHGIHQSVHRYGAVHALRAGH